MVERKESHQCEILTLIDPKRLDLQVEATILIAKSRLEMDEVVADLIDIGQELQM